LYIQILDIGIYLHFAYRDLLFQFFNDRYFIDKHQLVKNDVPTQWYNHILIKIFFLYIQ
jgi:hypothetical protein